LDIFLNDAKMTKVFLYQLCYNYCITKISFYVHYSKYRNSGIQASEFCSLFIANMTANNTCSSIATLRDNFFRFHSSSDIGENDLDSDELTPVKKFLETVFEARIQHHSAAMKGLRENDQFLIERYNN